MVIKGGLQGQPGNPNDPTDEGVFISKINEGGCVSKEPRLIVGQRIIEVNDASLLGASHSEAVSALREAGDLIKLLVCDGFNEPTTPPSNGTDSADHADEEEEEKEQEAPKTPSPEPSVPVEEKVKKERSFPFKIITPPIFTWQVTSAAQLVENMLIRPKSPPSCKEEQVEDSSNVIDLETQKVSTKKQKTFSQPTMHTHAKN